MKPRKTSSRIRAGVVLAVAVVLGASACGGSEPEATENPTSVVTAPAQDAVKALEDVRSAVVRIEAQGTFDYPGEGTQYNEGSSGSGFFVSPDGIAVTNSHVVTGAAFLQVYVEGETEPRNAKILGVSECSDLAVIDVEGEGFDYLAWYPDEVTVGTNVYAAGFPLGDHEYTLLDGIVSKENANGETNWASVDKVIEHTGDILPGNSGGPLVSEDGLVVGVNYAGSNDGQAFAIGHDEAGEVLPQLQAGKDVTSIGINGSAMVSDSGSGIWVYSVASGSPADLTGIRGGDIVTEVEGLIPATDGTMADYCDVLRSHDLDSAMQIEVWREQGGSYLEGTLNTDKTLLPLNGSAAGGSDDSGSGSNADPSPTAGGTLATGDCINDDQVMAYAEQADYSLSSCDEPHDNEVFYVHEYPGGAYPGVDALQADMVNVCIGAFEPYVGRDFESSALDLFPMWPLEDAWAIGNRSAPCLLFELEQNPMVGSAHQSGW